MATWGGAPNPYMAVCMGFNELTRLMIFRWMLLRTSRCAVDVDVIVVQRGSAILHSLRQPEVIILLACHKTRFIQGVRKYICD